VTLGRPKRKAELRVLMNGEDVGRLTRASTGLLRFEYVSSWFTSSLSRPLSMSMPLLNRGYSGEVVENFFENLLPDNVSIRNRIQARFSAASNNSFDLLWHVGRDCVGAIQILPENAIASDVMQVSASELTDSEIAGILKNYKTMPLGMSVNDDFRISIAGAQEKTALLFLDGHWCRPEGATPTSHIFKLPIGKIEHSNMDLTDSVENEWICHLILKEFGLPVADTDIAVFDDMKVLVVKRFDRRWADDNSWLIRLPQEDMCQALNIPPALKYESDGGPGMEAVMKFLLGSSDAMADRRRFMKTLLLFFLLGAVDGHAKNFSIFLQPGGRYSLTPSYDVISAYPLLAKKQLLPQRIKMAMAVKGKSKHYNWDHILRRHWQTSAQLCQFPKDEMASIIAEVVEQRNIVEKKVMAQVVKKMSPELVESVALPIFSYMNGLIMKW
jgi:serine/threonine-protein kinase HipA